MENVTLYQDKTYNFIRIYKTFIPLSQCPSSYGPNKFWNQAIVNAKHNNTLNTIFIHRLIQKLRHMFIDIEKQFSEHIYEHYYKFLI